MANTKKRGTFQAGQSGNPAGRPPGSGEAAKWRAALGKDAGKVIATVVRLAVAGDVGCCRLVLERCVPAMKPIEAVAPFPLPDGTLTDKADAVVSAIAAGTLAPQQGGQIVSALVGMARVIEIDEILRRIEQMEAHIEENRNPARSLGAVDDF